MHTNTAAAKAGYLLAAALTACTLSTGSAVAGSHPVTVAIKVSTQGIDPNQPAGAQELYRRMADAAWIACTRANRVGLAPSADEQACTEESLAAAIRSVHMPLVTLAYLEKHSLGQATAHGIEVPVQASAR